MFPVKAKLCYISSSSQFVSEQYIFCLVLYALEMSASGDIGGQAEHFHRIGPESDV